MPREDDGMDRVWVLYVPRRRATRSRRLSQELMEDPVGAAGEGRGRRVRALVQDLESTH